MAPPRPHLLARSRSAQMADRALEAIWAKGLQPCPELTPDAMWALGAEGFGEDDEHIGRSADEVADFRNRLGHLCHALTSEARLNSLGHTMAYGQIKSAIRMRHRLGRLWREVPGIEQTPIAPPIIVVGQMRAGTTRMHRLLAADPAHAGTPLYRAVDPVRPNIDFRPGTTRAALAMARLINPWIDTMHPFGARRVDEELPWLSYAFSPCALEAQYHIPSFITFSEGSDARPVYREFARILRSDAAQADDAQRPRVLKCPQFAEDLAPLLAQFPDARVVVTSRASEEVLASSVSIVASQMAYQSVHADLGAIEAEWQRKLALREARMAQVLAQFAGPVARVEFEALGADWEGELERVYAALGLDFTDLARKAMRAEMGRAKTSPHHRHASSYRKPAQN